MNSNFLYVLIINFIGCLLMFVIGYDSKNMGLAYASVIGFFAVLIIAYFITNRFSQGLGAS